MNTYMNFCPKFYECYVARNIGIYFFATHAFYFFHLYRPI
jgi:hypothetical protein